MVARRALIAGLVVAAAAFAATSFVYLRGAGLARVDFERRYEAAFVERFHARERTERNFFRWTTGDSAIVLQNLPPDGTLAVEARLRTVRPPGVPLPNLSFTANGITVHRARALPGLVTYSFEFPATSSRLVLGIESETFEVGERALGVQVLAVTVKSSSGTRPFLVPALYFTIAALLWFATGIVSRQSATVSAGAAIALSLVTAHLTSLEAVRFSAYPQQSAALALAILAFAVVARVLFDRIGWLHPSDRSVAIAFLSLLLLLKVGSFTYPLTIRSDADFQANRMVHFLDGNWYPTSVTQHQPPFQIPYPVALYLVTTPLAKLGVPLVFALELVTAVSDVLVSGLLLFLGWRFLDDFRAGAFAAVLYQVVPMNGLSFSAGNFTNLFAVSMWTLAFALLLTAFESGDRRAVAGVSLATLLALTAHFGMFLAGVALGALWVLLLWLCPAPVRDERRAITLGMAAAILVALVYYFGYRNLVTSQWERVLSNEGSSASGVTLSLLSSVLQEQLGLVFLATAFLGSLSVLRRPLDSVFHATSTGWIAATAAFLALELVTPVEIRYWLQVLPLLALLSGAYLSRALDRGRIGRLAAFAALAYTSFLGLRTLYESVVYRYH